MCESVSHPLLKRKTIPTQYLVHTPYQTISKNVFFFEKMTGVGVGGYASLEKLPYLMDFGISQILFCFLLNFAAIHLYNFRNKGESRQSAI